MNTTPYWLDTARIRAYPKLNRNLRVDVAVMGAGVTGISTAYLLKKAGAKVALIHCAFRRMPPHGMHRPLESSRTHVDCPCHGSRFRPTGEVLAGPAEADLAKVK